MLKITRRVKHLRVCAEIRSARDLPKIPLASGFWEVSFSLTDMILGGILLVMVVQLYFYAAYPLL